ncbi:MAG: HAD hydrolase family protein [Deinococcales bacterium]
MLKLVFLDIDGTLVGASGKVQACVFDATDQALAAGITLAICTGRPGLGIAQEIAYRIGPHNPHIFQNGAVLSFPDGQAVKSYGIDKTACALLAQHARKHQLTLELYSPTALYVEADTEVGLAHQKMIGVNSTLINFDDLLASDEPLCGLSGW